MSSRNRTTANLRVSRRRFFTMCQIAALPMLWPTVKMLEYAANWTREPPGSRDRTLDGHINQDTNVAVTALTAMAVLRGLKDANNPIVTKGLKSLESFVQPDGGIYTPGRGAENYETCLAMMCLAESNGDGRYDNILHRAAHCVEACQWNESQDTRRTDAAYGGAGYGRQCRPDLMNTAFLIDAIRSSRIESGSSIIAKALVFVLRCQDIEDASRKGRVRTNGGFLYSTVTSLDNLTNDGSGIPPHGSGLMTCLGLSSLRLAGVSPGDARIEAAMAWIRNHYDLNSNPGMGGAALYQYYHAFAKAMTLMNVDTVQDASGTTHRWGEELCEQLLRRQREDGSWADEGRCWMEDHPTVATAHALLAISYCRSVSNKTPTIFTHSGRGGDRLLPV